MEVQFVGPLDGAKSADPAIAHTFEHHLRFCLNLISCATLHLCAWKKLWPKGTWDTFHRRDSPREKEWIVVLRQYLL